MEQILAEGISLVLSRWTALQIAVQNEWAGRDSRHKVEELAASIFSWFCASKDELYIDDLEAMLDENMESVFNTVADDGSVEEVAEQLMILHEECLQGKYESIEKLRNPNPAAAALLQSRQVTDENESESSDEEDSDMMVDEPVDNSSVKQKPQTSAVEPDEDGWFVVAPRKNRGRRSG